MHEPVAGGGGGGSGLGGEGWGGWGGSKSLRGGGAAGDEIVRLLHERALLNGTGGMRYEALSY
jgi:hypothetical protein